MLETEIRTLILFRGDIVNRVLQSFVLVDRTNVQHCIIIQVAFGSCGEVGTFAGESDGIMGTLPPESSWTSNSLIVSAYV